MNNAKGYVFLYGSLALGVSSTSSDIDLCCLLFSVIRRLCVVPGSISEEDYFSSFYSFLSKEPRIMSVTAIPLAFAPCPCLTCSYVPLITVEIDEISVDLPVAFIDAYPTILPDTFSILDDSILKDVSVNVLFSTAIDRRQ